MTNPRRKRKNSFTRRRRRNPVVVVTSGKSRRNGARRRSNPFMSRRRRSSSRRRNPVIQGYGSADLLKVGISAAAGGYGTRALTQMLLSSNNTGWMGYLANGAVALALGYAADRFLGKDYGIGVIAGGFSATAIRIWSEQVSQTSPSQLSGMGDLDFSSGGMGDYISTPLILPSSSVKNANGQYINANPWPVALPAAPAAAASAGSGKSAGMGRVPIQRFARRW